MSLEANPVAGASSQNAVELLRVDHRRIAHLLADCERLSAPSDEGSGGSPADRAALVARLAAVLKAHAQVEEELFYPALPRREGQGRDDGGPHTDHAEITARLQDLADQQADAAAYTRCCAALALAVRDHVAHEEAELFAAAQGLDLQELGARIAVRRAELLGDTGVD